jgi:hypothetical protein
MDLHRLGEERSIALHARIGELLRDDPGVLDRARARLNEWARTGAVPRHYLAAWRRVLSLPTDELRAALIDPGEETRALRQVSPFAGALQPQERWRIRKQVAERIGGKP